MSQIKGVTFDLEGTLVDLEAAHHMGHIEAAREAGLSISLDQARAEIPSFVGGPDREVAKEFARRSGQPIALLAERMRFHFLRLVTIIPIESRPGVVAVLSDLRRLGLPLAIGSVTDKSYGLHLLREAGLLAFFRQTMLVFNEDIVTPKPSPDVFLRTAQMLGIEAAHQLVFEDSPVGVSAAVAAGSPVVGIPAVESDAIIRAIADAGASRVYRSWTEIDVEKLLREKH